MRVFVLIIVVFNLSVNNIHVFGQNSVARSTESTMLTINGSVLDTETMQPVEKVNVEVPGGNYTTTNKAGEFSIRARVGDELTIKSEGFETVYYTIKDNQRLRVEVVPQKKMSAEVGSSDITTIKNQSFDTFLTQARSTYTKDANQAIEEVAKALTLEGDRAGSKKQRAEAFELLGIIYTFWKQYDLAVANYRRSLENEVQQSTQIRLAKAYFLNKNYQESLSLYETLKEEINSAKDRALLLEGLADTYRSTGNNEKALENYKEAILLIDSDKSTENVIRLHSKLAETYEQMDNLEQALLFYQKALLLSKDQKSDATARTQVQLADFYNRHNAFAKEISMRKRALTALETVPSDSLSNADAITAQKQHYKIATAFAALSNYDEAIPFFERSIEEAALNEDIIVEKDATRKLSEVYRDLGDFEKASESYERYKSLVDESYVLKEQELIQATRFGKEIADKENRILSLEKDRALNESRYALAQQQQELIVAKETRQTILISSLAIITIVLTIAAVLMYRSNQKQKFANNVLALRGLRSQMNPHFIFNALNSVNSFIASNDERTANRYLSDFSQLMRTVLENSEEDFIPLEKEIALIRKYTMLEHFRFKDTFDYDIKVADNLEVDAFKIPPMLLQPYIENAVWHGLRYKQEKGHLEIVFDQLDQETAKIVIRDDGVGRTESKQLKTNHQKKQQSKGMGNINKRIEILNDMYKDRVAVSIEDASADGTGTLVTLFLKKN